MTPAVTPPGNPSLPDTPAAPPAPSERCPLCDAELAPDQEWCLQCGAAARTRLASPPRWRAPLLTALAVIVVSFAVLVAALVKLSAGSGTTLVVVPAVTAATAPAGATGAAPAAGPRPAGGVATGPATGATAATGATGAAGGTSAPLGATAPTPAVVPSAAATHTPAVPGASGATITQPPTTTATPHG